jgi:hypothetical protein
MSTQDSIDFMHQVRMASKRKAAEPAAPAATSDPTFDIRRRQANLVEATMVRVVELEAQAAALTEIAKKLRAAVVANT